MSKYRLSSVKKRLRSAACELREEHKQVNLAELSRKMSMHVDVLSNMLAFTIPEISLELKLVKASGRDWNQLQIFHLFKEAAAVVVREGDKPCPLFIAQKLKWNRERVSRYLHNHLDLAKQIGLHTDTEATVWRVGRQMRFKGEPVTLVTLSLQTGFAYPTIKKIMSRRPEFKEGVAIQKAKKGFGQCLYERKLAKKRVGVGPKPYAPDWCRQSRRRIVKPHLPAFIIPQDRIIVLLELRYRLEKGSLTQPSPKDQRFTRIRYLAMYLLKTDLKLSLLQIASIMNLRHTQNVKRGIEFIESQLTLLGLELVRLRRFCG